MICSSKLKFENQFKTSIVVFVSFSFIQFQLPVGYECWLIFVLSSLDELEAAMA